MSKRFTLYSVLIFIILGLLVANLFMYSFLLSTRYTPENRLEVSELWNIDIKTPKVTFQGLIKTKDIEYKRYYYGVLSQGESATYYVDVEGEQVKVELYQMSAFKYSITSKEGQQVEYGNLGNGVMKGKCTLYDDFAVLEKNYAKDDFFIVVYTLDYAKAFDAVLGSKVL